MASRASLSSDPAFLLELMHDLPEESDSDDDFDGYLEPEYGPVAHRSAADYEATFSPRTRSRSLNDLTDSEQQTALQTESPLAGLSPTLSPVPMQGEHASGSPLALLHSRSSPAHSQPATSSTLPLEVSSNKHLDKMVFISVV